MNKKFLISTIIGLILCSSIFLMGYKRVKSPRELFRVYLDGVSIGYIDSKEKLESYIDDKEDEIKNKYGVDKVYLPNNLSIEKEKTFNGHVMTPEEVYEQIKDRAPFTINGYEIRIKGVKEVKEDEEEISTTKTVVVYVLDKNVFVDSVEETIKAFIKEEEYEAFKNDLQKQITNTGKRIESVYIKNAITIREANISVENRIFTNKDDLSKFLLFGESTSEKQYIVKAGDTVEDVAYNNKMSSNELLVANPSLTSEDNLLYVGQELNVATIDPAFKVVEKDYVVEIQTVEYNTIYKDDKTLARGKEKVSVNGVNGSVKVAYNIVKENGDTIDVESESSVVLKKPVDKVILRGTKVESSGGGNGGSSGGSYTTDGVKANGVWFWPTIKPYKITSPYGYRGKGFHAGTDIQPTNGNALNSNIYSSNNGVVAQSGYTSYNGNFIVIDHGNGWFTSYGHLNKRLVKVGDRVSQGQVIGKMGKTGRATGVHLHFGLWKGAKPYYPGSTSYNPMKALKFQ